jgi:hypothetical protein
MNLRARLRRLERTTIVAGCPACRERRGRTVLLTARGLPDGTLAPGEDEPQPCVSCGQIPEQIIKVLEVIEPAAAEWSSPS